MQKVLVVSAAALSTLFASQASRCLAQSAPPEFTRPLEKVSKGTATPAEKELFTPLINDLDFKNKPAAIRKLAAFIAEHPNVRFGYSFRAVAEGCETTTPDLQAAYDDAKRALALPRDSFNTVGDDTGIAAKAALRLNKPKEAVALLQTPSPAMQAKARTCLEAPQERQRRKTLPYAHGAWRTSTPWRLPCPTTGACR